MMNGFFQGFGRALLKCFLLPLVLVVLSMGIMSKMGLMEADVSLAYNVSSGAGLSEQTKLYLLRIPGMRWILLEDGGVPTQRIVVLALPQSVRPQMRPEFRAEPTE